MTGTDAAGQSPEAAGDSAGRTFTSAGLELLEMEVSEAELAVIEAVDSLYRPLVDALIGAELDGVEPEPGADLSSGPRSLVER